jgi:hypothetical protein
MLRRSFLVLLCVLCVALVLTGCAEALNDVAEAPDASTTVAAATEEFSTGSEGITTVVETATASGESTATTLATTTTLDTAPIVAFRASVVLIESRADDLADEVDALMASIRAHRADLIKGDRGDICCNAHIELIQQYRADLSAEIASALALVNSLGPGQAELVNDLGPGQAELVKGLEAMGAHMDGIGSAWTNTGIGGGWGIADIPAALDNLTLIEALGQDVAKLGEICCSIRLEP